MPNIIYDDAVLYLHKKKQHLKNNNNTINLAQYNDSKVAGLFLNIYCITLNSNFKDGFSELSVL